MNVTHVGALLLITGLAATSPAAGGQATTIYQEVFQYPGDIVVMKPAETFVLGEAPSRMRLTITAPPVPPLLSVRMTAPVQNPGAATSSGGTDKQRDTRNEAEAVSVPSCAGLLPTIQFKWASTWVSPRQARALLDALATCHAKRITVTGYTCDLGSQDVNDRMALGRAEAVAKLLAANGYQAIDIKGFGKGHYVADIPGHRHQNRRVEVTVAEP
jgi:outer membrane protein OmpA-like peptidoglycan-associated protein